MLLYGICVLVHGENVGIAGFMAALILPVRDISIRAIRSHTSYYISKEPGVSLYGLALHFILFQNVEDLSHALALSLICGFKYILISKL